MLMRLPTMKPLRVPFLVISLFLLLLRCSTTQAQEAPFAVVEKFDTSVSYRTDLCDRQRLLWNNSIALPDALRGLNLTVSLTNYQTGKEKFFFTLKDGKIPEEDTALFTLILDEVSRRAGFSWRNSFIVYEPRNSTTDGDKTWTDILLWATEVVDISVEKWAHTVDRLSEGVAFPVGFFDSSMVLGEVFEPSQNKPVVDLWSFLKPFEANLWGTIVATIALSGMLYWAIERWNEDAKKRDPDNKSLGAAIFYAAMSFTAHFELEPISHSTRILSFSLTFWALIVASSYTANMASFLVSPRIAKYKYSTVDAILRQEATVCVQAGAALEMMLNEKYPSMRTVGKDSEEEIFQSLRLPPRRGGCDAVAHQFNVFELYEHDKDINYDCAISSEKRIAEILPSGMATAIVDKCTSLISAVLDYHLTSMIDDGFIETTWENHLNRHGSIDCVRDLSVGGGAFDRADTFSLTVQDVGGIFILHAFLTTCAILMATFEFYKKWKKGELDDSRSLGTVYGIRAITKSTQSLLRSASHKSAQKQTDSSDSEAGDGSAHGNCEPSQSDQINEPTDSANVLPDSAKIDHGSNDSVDSYNASS